MRNLLVTLVILSLFSCGITPNHSERFESNWQFKSSIDTLWLEAKVPGNAHLDLLANRLIDDPYKGLNEINLMDLENNDWEYKTTWNVTNEMLENDHVELVFHGLDTYADVFLNGSSILTTDNMFRTWRVDVRDFLLEGSNELFLKFTSPLNRNGDQVKNYDYKLPSGNETVDLKVGSFTRKAAYQFGWDWGPRFVSSGIWRAIQVESWNDARIVDSHVTTESISESDASMKLHVTIESDDKLTRRIQFNDDERTLELVPGMNEFSFDFTVSNPKLWWPNGVGEQSMHDLIVRLEKRNKVVDTDSIRYGIRTIELINEPDSIGTAYYFKVNGEPIFARGANYIPQDIFPSRVTVDQYERLIKKVKDANMNMIRVWGGGIYEDDIFYDLCDQNGIMIWQDFMFAGSMYPEEEEFHKTLEKEIEDNIRRIRKHPSLALWCGNNEIEVAWKNWGWQKTFGYSKNDSTRIWNNYLKIFHELIPEKVEELSPRVDYVTTSPLSNWGTPKNFNHSSMHYWGVWHGQEPMENFTTNVPRFMAEYGFQSFPSLKTLKQVVDSSQLSLDSEQITHRQKSYIGNGMIENFADRYIGESNSFEEFAINSQKVQAMAYKMAIQEHRLNKPHCMGTLFWQLNDCWQGPSWSVLEYDLTEKLAYQEVKKWYAPVVVIPKKEGEITSFYLVSDLVDHLDVDVTIKLLDADRRVDSEYHEIISIKNRSTKIYETISSSFQIEVRTGGKKIFEHK